MLARADQPVKAAVETTAEAMIQRDAARRCRRTEDI
jgi:hypothetical protein